MEKIKYSRSTCCGIQIKLRSNFIYEAILLAEGVGFEPTEVLPSTVFKTAAFDHSAIPP